MMFCNLDSDDDSVKGNYSINFYITVSLFYPHGDFQHKMFTTRIRLIISRSSHVPLNAEVAQYALGLSEMIDNYLIGL